MAPQESEGLAATHTPSGTADTHTRFTECQQQQHRRMRHPADDGTQKLIWRLFFLVLAVVVVGGLIWAMLDARAGRSEPHHPAASEVRT